MKKCKAIVFLVLILALSMLLVGCGSSSSSDGGGKDSEGSSSKGSKKRNELKDVVMVMQVEDTCYGFSKSGNIVKKNIDGSIKNIAITHDGKLFVFLTSLDELWTFDGSDYKKIAEDVALFGVAPCADSIVYADLYDTLFLYSNSKSKKIQEEVIASSFRVSPDGKTIAFSVEDDDVIKAYLYDGKIEELGRDIYPEAVSNGGKYIYLRRDLAAWNEYYVQKGTNADSVRELGKSFSNAIFNLDGSQVIYYDGSRTYFSEKGGEPQSLGSDSLSLLLPKNTRGGYYGGSSYEVSDLKNQYYLCSGDSGTNIYLLTNKLEREVRIKNVFNASLQPDGKTLVYLKNENLYSADISKDSPEAVKLAEYPLDYVVSFDGKTVLYMDEVHEVYTIKTGGGKTEMVSEDGYGDYGAAACGSGFLYITDGELFFTTGGNGKKVGGLSGDAQYVGSYPLYALIACEDGSYYMSSDGEKVQLIYGE